MKTIKWIFDWAEESILVILFASMAVMNFINVVMRYFFASSFSFTEEITVTAFVWVTMFGIAAGYKRVAHLGMSFFVDLMPRRLQMVMALFSMVCSVIMIAILLYYGADMVKSQIRLGSTTAALKMPMYIQGLSIPVGAAFTLLRSIQAGIAEFLRLKNDEAVKGGEA